MRGCCIAQTPPCHNQHHRRAVARVVACTNQGDGWLPNPVRAVVSNRKRWSVVLVSAYFRWSHLPSGFFFFFFLPSSAKWRRLNISGRMRTPTSSMARAHVIVLQGGSTCHPLLQCHRQHPDRTYSTVATPQAAAHTARVSDPFLGVCRSVLANPAITDVRGDFYYISNAFAAIHAGADRRCKQSVPSLGIVVEAAFFRSLQVQCVCVCVCV